MASASHGECRATSGSATRRIRTCSHLADRYKVTIGRGFGDEDLTASFHDGDLAYYGEGEDIAAETGFPPGLQFRQSLYSWSQGPLTNVILVRTSITNTTASLYLPAKVFEEAAVTRAIALAEAARTVLSSIVSISDENISSVTISGMGVAPKPIRGAWRIGIDDDRDDRWRVSIHDAAGILQPTATHTFDTPFAGPSLQPGGYVATLQRRASVIRKIVLGVP
ncbi:MAG: hypothetical protein BGO89_02500 [Candidatus Kapaibacterium thiocyanatum]|uniref:Uncharacterized protein n=1 Tax=Candidatus Kapaibacterium thiocyanatum TaxID=1895771 RepID=A0A1M3L276_9BACT|nr:MAG: hypothetical protein BGO89_02500 ['Candidatus Kapabacteria' thiocyanatum]